MVSVSDQNPGVNAQSISLGKTGEIWRFWNEQGSCITLSSLANEFLADIQWSRQKIFYCHGCDRYHKQWKLWCFERIIEMLYKCVISKLRSRYTKEVKV
ncbi:unnamed protein product [Onchocerca ochengi]|uniref:SelP_N domain-containing protein n=1 Tax=Onchocerca ochengi TaxID=42157 RepID=A0A182DX02_ONCOC|nr:unnamed protein product [Onchocerca ochengi]